MLLFMAEIIAELPTINGFTAAVVAAAVVHMFFFLQCWLAGSLAGRDKCNLAATDNVSNLHPTRPTK